VQVNEAMIYMILLCRSTFCNLLFRVEILEMMKRRRDYCLASLLLYSAFMNWTMETVEWPLMADSQACMDLAPSKHLDS
jgi:hypothetical protein